MKKFIFVMLSILFIRNVYCATKKPCLEISPSLLLSLENLALQCFVSHDENPYTNVSETFNTFKGAMCPDLRLEFEKILKSYFIKLFDRLKITGLYSEQVNVDDIESTCVLISSLFKNQSIKDNVVQFIKEEGAQLRTRLSEICSGKSS